LCPEKPSARLLSRPYVALAIAEFVDISPLKR